MGGTAKGSGGSGYGGDFRKGNFRGSTGALGQIGSSNCGVLVEVFVHESGELVDNDSDMPIFSCERETTGLRENVGHTREENTRRSHQLGQVNSRAYRMRERRSTSARLA